MNWQQIGYLLLAAVMIFFLVRMTKGQKNLFTMEKFVKFMGTFGWLAVFMIAVIAVSVFLLK